MPRHPNEALFEGEPLMPVIPSCEHFAGTEQRIQKAFELQQEMGGVFDITMDLEDGAPTGEEQNHAQMAARMQSSPENKYNMSGVRIHDYTLPNWRSDVDIVVGEAADRVAYITVPKCTD
ncbi:MAG TPA: CoA ester lyase, partial [Dehalococcoidia bacterium]|nr:CoA ester lyase [Dehalococcoidia bacterium]